jgi:TonB-linked SusC/RagA family outer membrane protein
MRRTWSVFAAVAVFLCTAFVAPQDLPAQERGTIRGTVTDAQTGEPILGAQVSIRGTGVGMITNNQGAYILTDVPLGRVEIRVEYLGYSAESRVITLSAGGAEVVDFQMGITAIELEELVATGYAQQTRREVSSAISSVSSEELDNPVVASLDALLQGKATGVQVTQNAGNPGVGMTVRVRGSSSITASNQPLYVVDGVPIWQGDFAQLSVGGQDLSAVTGLTPDDIESINILKDAAAAAIYGSNGSNGVVLITTKRGVASAGAPQMTVNISGGYQEASKRLDMLNAEEYVQYMSDAMGFDGFTQEEIDGVLSFVVPGADTDWQDEVLSTAPISNMQLALTGGTDRVKYYLSGAYFKQDGIVLGSAYDRASGRANLDIQATDRLSLSASLSLAHEDNDRIDSDNSIVSPIANAIANQPVIPVFDPDGSYSDAAEYSNPVAVGEYNEVEARTLRSFGSFTADFAVTDWLRASGRAGFDFLQLREYEYASPLVDKTYAAGVDGMSQIGNSQGRRILLDGYLTADHYFGSNEVSLTAGVSTIQNDRELSFTRGEGFTSPDLHWPTNAARPVTVDGTFWEHNLVSYFARGTYSFDNRFIFNGSVRSDGSSRFGENKKYGVFPSASLAWVVSNEEFMQDVGLFSDLRLRGSWGVTGNEAIGDFLFLGLYGSANYGSTPGVAPSNLPNPDLKWERTQEWNLGLEAGFVDSRLGVTFELYNKTTDDLLLDRPVTSTSGFTSVLANVGSIENRGWELALTTVNLNPSTADGFRWTTDFTISHNENEVTALAGDDEPFMAGFVNRVEVGEALGSFYLIRFEGVNSETGVAEFTNLNEDGEIDGITTDPNSEDRMIVGSPHPDYFGGLRSNMSWHGFDLSAFVEYSRGAEIYNGMREYADDGGWFLDNKFAHVMDYWKEPGDETDTPRPSYWYGDTGSLVQSSRFVEDGSYVRLQEVTLGYRLPGRLADLIRAQNARIYVSGRNLHTWTDYTGFNPDVNSFGSNVSAALGTDFYSYPLARTITFGFQGTF